MTTAFDTDIPIPTVRRGTGVMADLRAMEIGDSFPVNGDQRSANNARVMAIRLRPKTFTIRKTPAGYRAWRTA